MYRKQGTKKLTKQMLQLTDFPCGFSGRDFAYPARPSREEVECTIIGTRFAFCLCPEVCISLREATTLKHLNTLNSNEKNSTFQHNNKTDASL